MAEGKGHPMFEQPGPERKPEALKRLHMTSSIEELKAIGQEFGFRSNWLKPVYFNRAGISSVTDLFRRGCVVNYEDPRFEGTQLKIEVSNGFGPKVLIKGTAEVTIGLLDEIFTAKFDTTLNRDLARTRTFSDYRK